MRAVESRGIMKAPKAAKKGALDINTTKVGNTYVMFKDDAPVGSLQILEALKLVMH